MKKDKVSLKSLKRVIGCILEDADKERKASKKYKDLFKSGKVEDILRGAELDMTRSVLNACDIIKEKFGYKINDKAYHFLLALPIIVHKLEEKIKAEEGFVCCVDKTYFILDRVLVKMLEGVSDGKDTLRKNKRC